ncbi:MAG: B12-binding domain-containing radical SAM protein [Planctomycetes bacterium]|nr:B12-binding domain-containing radical SAM protein [Planctomycetota bacterium]MBI3847707.1 B12-binding domain-containing radical SAM protein [Planctomycetota bacterium]
MRVLFVTHSVDKFFYAGVASLSAFLKREGHETALINYDQKYDFERFRREVRASNAQMVGLSSLTYQWPIIEKLADIVKEELGKDMPTIAGGFHVSFSPDEVISSPSIDFACKGEGEFALMDLIRAMESGGDVHNIPNIWSKERKADGSIRVHRNEIRNLDRDLDSYPYWDRKLVDFGALLDGSGTTTYQHKSHVMPVAAGRGCPYRCAYCGNQSLLNLYKGHGTLVRRRSVEGMIAELKMCIDEYEVRSFEFWDEDFFAYQRQWLRDFFKRYKEEINLPFLLSVRADNCTDENLDLASAAGCHLLCMGIECGDEEFRRRYLNRNMSNEKIHRAFKRCRELGIERAALNIIGFPYETPSLSRKTLALNREIDPDYFHFYIYQAFPGCDLFEVCKKEGFLPDIYYAVYQIPESAIIQPSLTIPEIKELWTEFEAFRDEVDRKREVRHAARLAPVAT